MLHRNATPKTATATATTTPITISTTTAITYHLLPTTNSAWPPVYFPAPAL